MTKKGRNKKIELEESGLYIDIAFNENNGGLKATHINHTFDTEKGWYEKRVQEVGYLNGYEVILENECHNILNFRNTEGTWDGMPFEIASAETATPNNIKGALKHCAKKLTTMVAVIFFPNGYEEKNFYKGYNKYKGLEKLNDNQYKKFNIIFLIDNNGILKIIKP